jgi:hypothetical protein
MEAINRAEGTGLAIIFCDTEEDMRKTDEALNNMSPPAEASGRRVSAGVYEVMHDEAMALRESVERGELPVLGRVPGDRAVRHAGDQLVIPHVVQAVASA